MAYLDKSAQWSIKKEDTYGAGATFNEIAGEDIIELINPTMDASTDLIEREVMKNSLVKAQPLLGKETSSGSFGVELSTVTIPASSTDLRYLTGKVNGDILYESGLGKRINATPSEVASGVTAGVIDVLSGAVYRVGQAVKLTDASASTVEYAVIRSITGSELTVAPTPTASGLDVTVEGLVSFVIARPEDAAISLAVEEFFENATNQVTYTYSGVVVSDVTLNFPVANIVKADFSVAGSSFSVANAVGNRTSVCHSYSPYVAKNMTFTYAGTSYAIQDLTVNVASDVTDIEALTTDGITNKLITGKSSVGGSFGLEYNGVALFNAFQAGTSGELFGTVGNASSVMGIYAPAVIITKSSKSIDTSIYKDAADFTCVSSPICSDTAEDALTVFVG